MNTLVWQYNKQPKLTNNPIKILFAVISIYSMIFPIVYLDISLFFYQQIYFRILNIPKLSRNDYLVIDRQKLSKLNFIQRINCVYCGYVNGITAFAKAVANQTEIYSCAIKHVTIKKGQEHQKDFYEFEKYS